MYMHSAHEVMNICTTTRQCPLHAVFSVFVSVGDAVRVSTRCRRKKPTSATQAFLRHLLSRCLSSATAPSRYQHARSLAPDLCVAPRVHLVRLGVFAVGLLRAGEANPPETRRRRWLSPRLAVT